VGLGVSFAPTMATTSRWFIKRRGLALGIVTSGIGIGTLVMSPVITYFISVYGWRTAYLIVGFIAWTILIPAAFMLKSGPVENNALSDDKNRKEEGLGCPRSSGNQKFLACFVLEFLLEFVFANDNASHLSLCGKGYWSIANGCCECPEFDWCR